MYSVKGLKGTKVTKAVKFLEDLGYDVLLKKGDRIVYAKELRKQKYCDGCQYLAFDTTPDPYDSFSMDSCAICMWLKRKIQGGLEFYETKNIDKPLACPFLGREISEEEELEIEKWMEARKL